MINPIKEETMTTPATEPISVALCGSLTRAATDLHRVHRALALAGHLVDAPVPPVPGEPALTSQQRANLNARHRAAINRSHIAVAVIPDGQAGDATTDEMAYAQASGKSTLWVIDVDRFVAAVLAGCSPLAFPVRMLLADEVGLLRAAGYTPPTVTPFAPAGTHRGATTVPLPAEVA